MKYINPKYDLKPVTVFSPSEWIEPLSMLIMMEQNGVLFNPGEQKITSAEAYDLARDEIERLRNE
jgi:hypothetical protein